MSKNAKLILTIVIFAVVLIGAYMLYGRLSSEAPTSNIAPPQQSSDESQENEKIKAPDFTAYDADGNAVKLSDFEGKPVVLNFWASWCTPCKSEMPDFNDSFSENGDEINYLMVNMTDGSRETVDIAKDYVEKQGFEFPVYFDKDFEAAVAYGVSSIPMTFFIDAEGYVVTYAKTVLDKDTLEYAVGMLTNK